MCTTKMLLFCFYLILFHIQFVVSISELSNHAHLSNDSDQEALLGFKSALNSWNPSINSVNITAELCGLPNFQKLNLWRNNLTGTIQACLGNISSLENISLDEKNVHESVPSEFVRLIFKDDSKTKQEPLMSLSVYTRNINSINHYKKHKWHQSLKQNSRKQIIVCRRTYTNVEIHEENEKSS